MQRLEDVEVVDGEPVAASLIPRAVTAGELLFDDGASIVADVPLALRGTTVRLDVARVAVDIERP